MSPNSEELQMAGEGQFNFVAGLAFGFGSEPSRASFVQGFNLGILDT